MTTLLKRPVAPPSGGVLLGRNSRSGNLFTLAAEDRTTHCHVVGASRKGKSNFLEVMIRQDIIPNNDVQCGITVLDPHGSMYTSLLAWIAEHRIWRYRNIRILDPTDVSAAFSLNPFVALASFDRTTLSELLTNATLAAFGQHAVTDTPMIAEVLQELYSALGALGLPFADATDFIYRGREKIREHHLKRLDELDPEGADFWRDLERLPTSRRDEYLAPVRRRLRPFLRSPYTRRIFSQTERALDLATAMDEGDVVLVNLKPGPNLSGDSARLLGALLVNEAYTACFRRQNRLQHFLYLDECARFLSTDVARILDESRKFGLSMVLAHQHLSHLREAGEHIFRSVMTNTFVKVVFGGLDAEDAEYMAKLVFRGTLNLERPKERLYRPTAVGSELVQLKNESSGTSVSETRGTTWSRGSSVSESSSETESRSRTKSKARSHTDSSATSSTKSWARSHTDSWSQSHGESESTSLIDSTSDTTSASDSTTATPGTLFVPGDVLAVSEGSAHGSSDTSGSVTTSGTTDTYTTGGSDTETEGGSFTRSEGRADTKMTGIAVTRGTAKTKGRSTSASSEHGGSAASSIGRSTSQGTSEAYVTRYELMPGPLWELADQLHVKSVAIAHVPVGQAWVRIGAKHPRRLVLPYLGEQYVLPARLERVRRTLLAATPFVAPAEQVDREYVEHRTKLAEAATPQPVEEPETWREGGE